MNAETHIRAREGFALPVALIAMIVIGAMVTGGFYASTREHPGRLSPDLGAQALYVAEYGLDRVLGTWVRDSLLHAVAATADGGDLGPVPVSTGASVLGHYTLSVERLGEELALVRSTGAAEQVGARATRDVGAVVRITSNT
jgi:hypothetical protein